MFDLPLMAALLALGLLTGFLAGLLGIGGGMVMVPFITLLLAHKGIEAGLAVKMAIATSMATIVFTSLSSVRAHHKKRAVRWDLVSRLSPGIVLGAALASVGVFSVLKGNVLALLFAGFVGFSATQMLLNKKPAASRRLPGTLGQWGAGGVIGFLSGLVGAGGGFVSVPYMTWCNVAIHNAVATSSALGFPIALANTVGYIVAGKGLETLPSGSFGFVYLPALAAISVTSVLTAPWGAKAAHALPVATLKRVFALVLYLLAGYMLYRGIST
jgi:uncharacterized protein